MFVQGHRIDKEIVEIVAKNQNTTQDLVKKIHSFQFKIVKEAIKKSKSIEITDLGVIKTNPKMIKMETRRLQKFKEYWEELLKHPEDQSLVQEYKEKLEMTNRNLKYLNSKL